MTKTKLILTTVFLISLAIRLFQSNLYPPLLWDEAALGYNAYSIIKTGRDEYGKFLPLIFKSFGDYKPGLYVYAAIPFIATFGLSPLTTRLPSILAGSLMPLLIYLIITTISPKQKGTATIAALILAINPYNIHFSKGAWESNFMLFEILLATFFFLRSTQNNNRPTILGLLVSSIVFALTFYTYQSAKMITPLIIICLFFLNKPYLKLQYLRLLIFFIIPTVLLCLPLLIGIIFSQDANRLQTLGLWSYPRSQQETVQIINESNTTDYYLFHGQPWYLLRNFSERYLNHFSPKFLFFSGDWQNPRHSTPYIGVLLYPSLIFLVIGLFSSDYRQRLSQFFLLWLLVAPIPAALTRDTIQAVRSLPVSIPLVYFIASGIFLSSQINKYKTAFLFFTTIAYVISFVYYSDLFYQHLVKKSPADFLYGYREVINYINDHPNNYDRIYFTDFYGQPYIYYLFYSRYNPIAYQQQANLKTSSIDTGKVEKLDNIIFDSVNFVGQLQSPKTLLIMARDEIYRQELLKNSQFVNKAKPVGQINGQALFYLYETQ